MMPIEHLFAQARKYAETYPGDIDKQTRKAIFWSHLAYLINTQSLWLMEVAQA